MPVFEQILTRFGADRVLFLVLPSSFPLCCACLAWPGWAPCLGCWPEAAAKARDWLIQIAQPITDRDVTGSCNERRAVIGYAVSCAMTSSLISADWLLEKFEPMGDVVSNQGRV